MTKQVQLRRGTTAEHAGFTGANGELTYDTDKKQLVIHDGATAGGKSVNAPINCTEATIPASPYAGQQIFVTDSDLTIAFRIYTSDGWKAIPLMDIG
jgi:hypothetical protein